MLLGKVTGTLVSTVKNRKIVGNTIKVVEIIDLNGHSLGSYEIAADTVGSKVGDYVITVKSSSARMTKMTEDKPIDNSIIAIVDIIVDNGKTVYDASQSI